MVFWTWLNRGTVFRGGPFCFCGFFLPCYRGGSLISRLDGLVFFLNFGGSILGIAFKDPFLLWTMDAILPGIQSYIGSNFIVDAILPFFTLFTLIVAAFCVVLLCLPSLRSIL